MNLTNLYPNEKVQVHLLRPDGERIKLGEARAVPVYGRQYPEGEKFMYYFSPHFAVFSAGKPQIECHAGLKTVVVNV